MLCILKLFIILIFLPIFASAGENITVYNHSGHPLKPSQIKNVDIHKTCGTCHDVKAYAETVHFNRKKTTSNSEKTNCLACHIGSKNAFNISGNIKKAQIKPQNNNCVSCHSNIGLSSNKHSSLNCLDCHRSAGHKNTLNSLCVSCHSTKGALHLKATDFQKKLSVFRETQLKPASCWLFAIIFALCAFHYAVFGPCRIKFIANEPQMLRFSLFERFFHWLAMGSFAFLATSGVMFLMQIDNPHSSLRFAHGCVGVIFIFSLMGIFACWKKSAGFVPCDLNWIKKMGGYLWKAGDCPSEKFNAGQKLFFWGIAVLCGLMISATGILLMFSHGQLSAFIYTLHDLAAVFLISSVIAHIYLGVFACPGSISAIINGRVNQSWAKKHHSVWHGKQNQ